MNNILNSEEKELIKLANYFKKSAEKLINEGRLGEENREVISACNNLIEKLYIHAKYRQEVLDNRENLKKVIKDNATCPKCESNSFIKYIGVSKEEEMSFNKYKCRKCNIQFVWGRPNNPWDMITFLENLIANVKEKLTPEDSIEGMPSIESVRQLENTLLNMKSSIEVADQEYSTMKTKDLEMAKMIYDFKNYLLMEKIKMDMLTNPYLNN